MKAKSLIGALALVTLCTTGAAHAASWQDQLSSAANQLSQQSNTTSTTAATGTQGGLSMASLASLLNGGNKALSSGTMTNVAGILGYCAKQKLASVTDTQNIKTQLMDKLGLASATEQKQTTDYQQGLMGLLNSSKDQQISLSSLGNSPLAQQVKTKACDLVLKQGMNFLS